MSGGFLPERATHEGVHLFCEGFHGTAFVFSFFSLTYELCTSTCIQLLILHSDYRLP